MSSLISNLENASLRATLRSEPAAQGSADDAQAHFVALSLPFRRCKNAPEAQKCCSGRRKIPGSCVQSPLRRKACGNAFRLTSLPGRSAREPDSSKAQQADTPSPQFTSSRKAGPCRGGLPAGWPGACPRSAKSLAIAAGLLPSRLPNRNFRALCAGGKVRYCCGQARNRAS